VAWVDRLRRDNAERATREAWAAGYRGGQTVERTEIAAHIRAELEAGHYDYHDGNFAAREILARLDQVQRKDAT
jgi:hypothetical protein